MPLEGDRTIAGRRSLLSWLVMDRRKELLEDGTIDREPRRGPRQKSKKAESGPL
jgi:hypothetical protein